MAVIGNEKRKLNENEEINLQTKLTNHKTNNPLPPRITSDLNDKVGKDGKLTVAEPACCFANNLCLFCGGVGHTVKECPRTSSSAAKAKGRAAKAQPETKSDSTPAEDAKK